MSLAAAAWSHVHIISGCLHNKRSPAVWLYVGVQVEVVAAGLSGREGAADFLYYPAMPGNCTARPAEKWALQVHLCQM